MALTYRNPVYPHYFADPFVWKHGGEYFAVGTGPVGEKELVGETDFVGTRDYGLVRYDSNGNLDPTFGTGGKIVCR